MHAAGHVYEGIWEEDMRHGKVGSRRAVAGGAAVVHRTSRARCRACDLAPCVYVSPTRQGRYVTRDGHETVGVWVKDVGPGGMRSRGK